MTAPDDIPWDRVVHFYGRAGEVPRWIAALDADSHEAAERSLRVSLEHQDKVIQATPLAVRLILRSLAEGRVRDPYAVRSILHQIGNAARYQVDTMGRHHGQPSPGDWSLFRDENLWPPFETDQRDEVLWEEWHPTDDEILGWARLTESLLCVPPNPECT